MGLVFALGAGVLGASGAAHARSWLALARGPWALPAAIAAFATLAFLGVPQFALIAAAVAAFGPERGAIYSWVGTMASALIGYGLGRAAGARILGWLAIPAVDRFTALTRRHGILASLAVRLAPFAPFVVVNVAAGTAGVAPLDFIVGSGIGIVPKIALTAFAGDAALRGLRGWVLPVLLLAAAAVWISAGMLARRWIRRS